MFVGIRERGPLKKIGPLTAHQRAVIPKRMKKKGMPCGHPLRSTAGATSASVPTPAAGTKPSA